MFQPNLQSFPNLAHTNSGCVEPRKRTNPKQLSNRHINWDDFQCIINERLTLNFPLKTEEDIEVTAKFFNDTIRWVGWNAMPEHKRALKAYSCPIIIMQKVEEKRGLHRECHHL
jgi:hypothetical protein